MRQFERLRIQIELVEDDIVTASLGADSDVSIQDDLDWDLGGFGG